MPPRAWGPAPPIDTEYPTLEQVEKGFKAHALAHGYSLVPKSYYPTNQTASRAIYRCAKQDDIVAWYRSGVRTREIVRRLASLDPPITGVTNKNVMNLLARCRLDEPDG